MHNEPLRPRGLELLTGDSNRPLLFPFVCPGSSQPVSRAVHLSRLNAAWPDCDQCEWRHDTEGLADRTIQETERIRDNRADGIRRTEFGVRGQYINDIDRRNAADLARIFCRCLHERPSAAESSTTAARVSAARTFRASDANSQAPAADMNPTLAALAPVVVGYDGRSSSPDIFVGMTAAVREFGLPVLDIGRCTAASIQEAARSFPQCSGAIFVTGADSPTSWTGLDAFDTAGDPLPVVWKDFGIRLQHVSIDHAAAPALLPSDGAAMRDDIVSEMLNRIRREDSKPVVAASASLILKLQLPPHYVRTSWQVRLSRSSGSHTIVDFEDRYRQWLMRWFPARSSLRIQVRTDDLLIRQRMSFLAEATGMEIVCRGHHEPCDLPSSRLTMTMSEDDRQFQLVNANGAPISAEQLAVQLNAAIHSQASQVTAHSDLPTGRFWLTDASRPMSGGQTEQIRDAVAVLGLIVKLIELGRLALHS